MKVHLDDIALLYEVWTANKQNIVGFYPRRMFKNEQKYSWDGPDGFDQQTTLIKHLLTGTKMLTLLVCQTF